MNTGLSSFSLSLIGYDSGNIGLGLESYLPLACWLTSTGCSKRVDLLIQTQQNRHQPGPDLRQAGPQASLTIGVPMTSSCSVNRDRPFL